MGSVSTDGALLPDEKLMNINNLEMKAVFLALKLFTKINHEHITVISDNTIAIQCINKMVISCCREYYSNPISFSSSLLPCHA